MGSYMVRYPLGGNLSWALQYLVGFKELGHDVYFVEKYSYPNSCYDPVKQLLSDDCSYGVKVVSNLLDRYGLGKNWCYVENGDVYHGLSKKEINDVFKRADLYIENGSHHAWSEESASATLRAFIDQDPALTQISFYDNLSLGRPMPIFDKYYTIGMNIGKPGNEMPLNNIKWNYLFNPVNSHLFKRETPPNKAPYSTVMNWKSYSNVRYNNVVYGQKDEEFEKFICLPELVNTLLEVAVSGLYEAKEKELKQKGWSINNAQRVTLSLDSFREYLTNSRGEFSVCKNMYVATNSGWFSDKSAAYMASGRPVVVQETGFSGYLPVGEGLFAVNNVGEAKNAIEIIESKYDWHCKKAFEIACEYLEAKKVLGKFLSELGI